LYVYQRVRVGPLVIQFGQNQPTPTSWIQPVSRSTSGCQATKCPHFKRCVSINTKALSVPTSWFIMVYPSSRLDHPHMLTTTSMNHLSKPQFFIFKKTHCSISTGFWLPPKKCYITRFILTFPQFCQKTYIFKHVFNRYNTLKKPNFFLQKNTKKNDKKRRRHMAAMAFVQGSTAAVEPLWVSWPPSWDPWGAPCGWRRPRSSDGMSALHGPCLCPKRLWLTKSWWNTLLHVKNTSSRSSRSWWIRL
jgi:hypothetical protein